ncbi:hypothetical protein [Diaphorobacter sp. J5-51]|uniref:hypothetical protein n=1 Tax=Diaphorobacter sp. J5-51 TaxID=680496 RepID=UPI000643E124|nr:hypothetical protein [Diaphorobacter sp. J5-51]KLR58003.1 hypothetical protein OX89_09310 [Diaphorobacter sp. J5-51]
MAAKKTTAGDTTRTERAKAHLERLVEAKGKRLLVDLDADGNAALEALVASGYGATNKAVVIRALIAASKRIKKP